VDRWRGVFLQFAEDFGDRSPGALTTDEAQEWADSLITSERTPRTVRDVWIVAARTVFGWAKHRKLIAGNPFTDVKVSELQPNHAWRHTFKQIADRVGISERMSDYITGHSQKSVGASYGAPTLSDMASALKRFPRYSLSDAG
jgi:hypothetical protein